MSIRSMHGLLF